jgi:hypothetical protein
VLLKKSLYGDRVANETQSQWLTSSKVGFKRLTCEGSINVKRSERGTVIVLNRFDVKLLGQATWYLQSRITQLADYSIILDQYQSRFAALRTARYLPLNDVNILKERYASPLPTTAVFTKLDCSPNYAAVLRLQEEFKFDYVAVIGSLIWLMSTFITTLFANRKFAKFMQFPGKQHFGYLKHLLHQLQCNRCSGGIRFYSDLTLSPLYQFLVGNGNVEHALARIIRFTDSSYQDCPDTSRSTGGYLTFT